MIKFSFNFVFRLFLAAAITVQVIELYVVGLRFGKFPRQLWKKKPSALEGDERSCVYEGSKVFQVSSWLLQQVEVPAINGLHFITFCLSIHLIESLPSKYNQQQQCQGNNLTLQSAGQLINSNLNLTE